EACYRVDETEARRHARLALCNWLLHIRHDREDLDPRRSSACRRTWDAGCWGATAGCRKRGGGRPGPADEGGEEGKPGCGRAVPERTGSRLRRAAASEPESCRRNWPFLRGRRSDGRGIDPGPDRHLATLALVAAAAPSRRLDRPHPLLLRRDRIDM